MPDCIEQNVFPHEEQWHLRDSDGQNKTTHNQMKRESCYLLMDTTILSDIPKCLLNTLHEIAPFWTCQNHKCPLCRILLTRVLICSLQTSRLPQTQAVCVMVKWPFHRHVGLPCPTKGSCGAEWPNCSSCSLHRCMVIVGFVS